MPIEDLSGCVDTGNPFALTPVAQLISEGRFEGSAAAEGVELQPGGGAAAGGRSWSQGAELESTNRPKRKGCGLGAL